VGRTVPCCEHEFLLPWLQHAFFETLYASNATSFLLDCQWIPRASEAQSENICAHFPLKLLTMAIDGFKDEKKDYIRCARGC
jgi:hypothetical protein